MVRRLSVRCKQTTKQTGLITVKIMTALIQGEENNDHVAAELNIDLKERFYLLPNCSMPSNSA